MYLPLIFILLIVGASAEKREVCKELVRLPAGLPKSFIDNLMAEYQKDDLQSRIVIRTRGQVETILSCSLHEFVPQPEPTSLHEFVPQPEPTILQFFMVMGGFIIFWTIFILIIYYDLTWLLFTCLSIYLWIYHRPDH